MGLACKALGDAARSKAFLEKASAARGGKSVAYYAGLALLELGRKEEARKVFEGLAGSGRGPAGDPRLAGNFHEWMEVRREAAEAHYAAGLGFLGLGRAAEAQGEFRKALRLDGSHVGAWRHARRD